MYFNLDKLFDGFNLTKKTLQKNKKFYKNIFKIQQEEVSSICNSMSPISKHKTLKRMSSIPGMILVKKRLHKFTNLRILMKMILFKNLVKKLFLSWWTMILHLSVETRKRRGYLIGRIELKFCTKSLCLRQ